MAKEILNNLPKKKLLQEMQTFTHLGYKFLYNDDYDSFGKLIMESWKLKIVIIIKNT